MRPDAILALVDAEQATAVLADTGPLLIVAGAGTGKTRALTTRVAYRVATRQVAPESVLAVTHSTRSAGEMRDRFRRLDVDGLERVSARTIHAAALRQLSHFWPATGRGGELVVSEDRYAVLRAGLARRGVRNLEGVVVADLLSEIEWAKSRLVTPHDYVSAATAAGRTTTTELARVAVAYQAYQEQLRDAAMLDFTDLLTETASLLERRADVAAQVRQRYHALCVDEYQDVDPAQHRLIDAWLGRGQDLTVVGDPRQSIYGFKGADPSLLTTFSARHPGATVITLTSDYRSTPQVVAVANSLAAAADPHPGPKPRTKAGRAQWLAAHPSPLTGMRPAGPTAIARCLDDEGAEPRWIAAQIAAALRAGTPAEEVAVLYRYNGQAAPFEQALAAAGIPYRLADGDRFFDRVEIRTVVTEMQRRVGVAGQGLAARHARDEQGESGWDSDGGDGGDLVTLSGPDLLRDVLQDLGWQRDDKPDYIGQKLDRWESRSALLRMVEDVPGSDSVDALSLIEDLENRRLEAAQVTTRSVTLATVHKAKGLEWDVVFCPGWVEGTLPISFARTAAALEEERRLAYVAVTRARRTLVVTYAKTRTVGRGKDSRVRPATPSRFLTEAGFAHADGHTTAAAAAAGRRRAARSASQVARCSRCSLPLEDASLVLLNSCTQHLSGEAGRRWSNLREWRTDMAKIEAVKPYLVLSDATLLALVAHSPHTPEELAQVKGIGPAKLGRYGSELISLLHRRVA